MIMDSGIGRMSYAFAIFRNGIPGPMYFGETMDDVWKFREDHEGQLSHADERLVVYEMKEIDLPKRKA